MRPRKIGHLTSVSGAVVLFGLLQLAPLRMSLHLSEVGPSGGTAQVYWRRSGQPSFSESQSSRFPLVPGTGAYRLLVPRDSVALRLDPLAAPGQLRILEIGLSNILGFPLASWRAGPALLDEWQPNEEIHATGTSTAGTAYVATGPDPSLTFDRWLRFIPARRWVMDTLYAACCGLLLVPLSARLWRQAPSPDLPLGTRHPASQGGPRAMVLNLATAAVAVLISISLGEAAYRAYVRHAYLRDRPVRLLQYQAAQNPAREYEFQRELWNTTYAFGSGEKSFSFHLNSLGFRGPEWAEARTGAKRLLAIGDSYTFGWAVNDEETFPAQTQALFLGKGETVEVLNGGVPGYQTPQEAATLEELSNRFHPDAVVLAMVMNDAQPVGALGTPPQTTYRFVRFWLLADLEHWLNLVYDPAHPVLDSGRFMVRSNYIEDFEAGSPGWRASRDSVARMTEYTRARGIGFSILIYPDTSRGLDDTYPYTPIHRELRRWALELGVPVRDLLDDLRGRNGCPCRVPWDGHPSREAHRAAAQAVVRLVDEARSRPPGRVQGLQVPARP